MKDLPIYVALLLIPLVMVWSLTKKVKEEEKSDLRPVKAQTDFSCEIIQESSAILRKLRKGENQVIEGIDQETHYLAPHVPKLAWTSLGNLIVQKEKQCHENVPGEKWISLRLDGTAFSKTVKAMRRAGVLEAAGFSQTFAECMQTCCFALMEHLNAKVGYTQSDEMIVFIAPNVDHQGQVQEHVRSGRVTKLTTLAAGFVSTKFVMHLTKKCREKGGENVDKLLESLDELAPHFDCRMASYDSFEEAQALLLWRAYDCSVNGVSDAVHHQPHFEGKKGLMKLGMCAKLIWLSENDKLPLPKHQAFGTYFQRVKRVKEGYNPIKKETVKSLRNTTEQKEGVPILKLAIDGDLLPVDDHL